MEISDITAAESVDGLVRVPDSGQAHTIADEFLKKSDLPGAHILILIYENIRIRGTNLRSYVWLLPEKKNRIPQDIIKINQGAFPHFLTKSIDLGVIRSRQALSLPAGDPGQDIAQIPSGKTGPDLPGQGLDLLRGGDRKGQRERKTIFILAQQMQTKRMKCPHRSLTRQINVKRAKAIDHFAGGLVGKGDGQDLLPGLEPGGQTADAPGNGRGLARPRTGNNKKIFSLMPDRG